MAEGSGGAGSSKTASQAVVPMPIETFVSLCMLDDPQASDKMKLRAAEELSENLEVITQCPSYPAFLEHSMKIFVKVFQEGEPHFILQSPKNQLRNLILKMIDRLPITLTAEPYGDIIVKLCLGLLRTDNEENVLLCLRIFREWHDIYWSRLYSDMELFATFAKKIYSDLPNHMPNIFEAPSQIRVKELKDLNLEQLLQETYTITPIRVENTTAADGTTVRQWISHVHINNCGERKRS